MCPHKVDVNLKFDLSAIKFIARHRRIAIEQCIEALTHSCVCHDAFCRRSSCMKMKRVVIHTSICKRKIKGNCPICKQLIALCCYHAKNCREVRCWVPFCNTVKTKLRRQHLLFDRLDAARGLRPQPDPEESDTIDVNMSQPYPFGDDGPSGSGSADGTSESTDSGDEDKPNEDHQEDIADQEPEDEPQAMAEDVRPDQEDDAHSTSSEETFESEPTLE